MTVSAFFTIETDKGTAELRKLSAEEHSKAGRDSLKALSLVRSVADAEQRLMEQMPDDFDIKMGRIYDQKVKSAENLIRTFVGILENAQIGTEKIALSSVYQDPEKLIQDATGFIEAHKFTAETEKKITTGGENGQGE